MPCGSHENAYQSDCAEASSNQNGASARTVSHCLLARASAICHSRNLIGTSCAWFCASTWYQVPRCLGRMCQRLRVAVAFGVGPVEPLDQRGMERGNDLRIAVCGDE